MTAEEIVMVKISDLYFKYPKQHDYVLAGISYEFLRGNLYFLRGENGAGKTTLVKLILGLLKPTEGRIVIDTKVVSYLPDYNGIYQNLTIIENIKYRLALYNLSYEQNTVKILSLLERYDLEQHKNKLIRELSHGMQKKVGFICACIVEPQLLILDEPTEGLDADSHEELVRMMGDLIREDAVVLCITHDKSLLSSGKGVILDFTSEGTIDETA